MSRLTDFYRGEAADAEGRFLADVWAWDDDELEVVHDYIQWLFPLAEPSQFNPDAPLLSPEDIAAFRQDSTLQANLRKSFERILRFLGLTLANHGAVVEGENFAARTPDVWAYPNHNWLRITRILGSMTLLGLGPLATALYGRLNAFYTSRKFPISAETFQYWTDAVHRPAE
jgi:hypothetical protein